MTPLSNSRSLFLITLSFCLLVVSTSASAGVEYQDVELYDTDRNRDVPCRIYTPDILEGVYPVVLFSHGLGGSREVAGYFGEHLAENGYIVVYMQHHGSDREVWREYTGNREEAISALVNSLSQPSNALNRFQDIPFVLDELERLNSEAGWLQGHLDLENIGMAGHSYGAKSTMVAVGEKMGRLQLSFSDDRISAGIVLSPNISRAGVNLDTAYSDVNVPLLHITGTEDRSPLPWQEGIDPIRRTEPYENIDFSDQYLFILESADHMVFSGSGRSEISEIDTDRYLSAVKDAALAFFNAYLKGDNDSLEWLRYEFPLDLSEEDIFSWK